ncbi:hypothetical protein K9M74_00270 [Candidatus Woesearchaeota archaeon]|nr:hypothetical protein [Candidatus Woesearchaeota archaeon]
MKEEDMYRTKEQQKQALTQEATPPSALTPEQAEQYKTEANEIVKEVQGLGEKLQPHQAHMHARHIDGLHKLYTEKLGYKGPADLESMKEFKHNYFSDKTNYQETIDFLTDHHVHNALLTYGMIKDKKPLTQLDEKTYTKLVHKAKTEAQRLRKEDKGMYNTLLKEYAGVTSKKLLQTIIESEHQFIEAYTQQLLPKTMEQYVQKIADIHLADIMKKIKPQHEHVVPELKRWKQQYEQERQKIAYQRAMEGDLEEENYQLPEQKILEPTPGSGPAQKDATPQGGSGAPVQGGAPGPGPGA